MENDQKAKVSGNVCLSCGGIALPANEEKICKDCGDKPKQEKGSAKPASK